MRMPRALSVFAVLGFVLLRVDPARAAAFFVPLGVLEGGDFSSALGISADGSTVVGVGNSRTSISEPFRWTSAGGMEGLGGFFGQANGASADGSVVVGYTGNVFRWTSADGRVDLGFGPDRAFLFPNGVSADGSVVVGTGLTASGEWEATRWTSAGGAVGLGDLPGGQFQSIATGVSGDGSIVVGRGLIADAQLAFRWTSAGGMVSLGDLPGGETGSMANDISLDGSTIVGVGRSAIGDEAFRWTSGGGMEGLGFVPGDSWSTAYGVSADGSTIVGTSSTGPCCSLNDNAFIWDATNGMRPLDQVLTELGADLTGWKLNIASGVSADGRAIVGSGINPIGHTVAWLAVIPVIPEPTTLTLLGAGIAALAFAARRRRA